MNPVAKFSEELRILKSQQEYVMARIQNIIFELELMEEEVDELDKYYRHLTEEILAVTAKLQKALGNAN